MPVLPFEVSVLFSYVPVALKEERNIEKKRVIPRRSSPSCALNNANFGLSEAPAKQD